MFIRICDLNIEIMNKYDFLLKQCEDYIITNPAYVDFKVEADEKEIYQEHIDSGYNGPIGLFESSVILRKIAYKVLEYKGILIHSSVLSVNDKGYAFLAPSGTGKSTHCELWLKYKSEENIEIINGDKPIYRLIDDSLYVYGTPWAGKEGYNKNKRVIMKSFCFIERAKVNEIIRLDNKEVVKRLLKQVLIPSDVILLDKTIEILNQIVINTPFYLLKCNISKEAVDVSFERMVEDNED